MPHGKPTPATHLLLPYMLEDLRPCVPEGHRQCVMTGHAQASDSLPVPSPHLLDAFCIWSIRIEAMSGCGCC